MKSALKIISVFFASLFVLSACSNISDEPLTSTAVDCSYIDPISETYPLPENADDFPGVTFPLRYIEGPVNIECVYNSYYVDGSSVARIKKIEFAREEPSFDVHGDLYVKIEEIGSRRNGMNIAYTCYDKQGNVLGETFMAQIDLKDAKEGDLLRTPLTVIDGTSKIVFSNCD